MKPAQINKLYNKLTPHEQAALVIEAAARFDESDVDAILAHVERKTYVSVHADYSQRIFALQALIAQYGIEYWKNRALMLLSCIYAEEGHPEAETIALQFLAKTIALEHVITDICNRLKIDVEAIKKSVSCPLGDDAHIDDFSEVDADIVKQYADMFSPLLEL